MEQNIESVVFLQLRPKLKASYGCPTTRHSLLHSEERKTQKRKLLSWFARHKDGLIHPASLQHTTPKREIMNSNSSKMDYLELPKLIIVTIGGNDFILSTLSLA